MTTEALRHTLFLAARQAFELDKEWYAPKVTSEAAYIAVCSFEATADYEVQAGNESCLLLLIIMEALDGTA